MENKNLDESFQSALNSFNFGKVYKIMQLLDWKWYSDLSDGEVPSTYRMIKTCEGLYKELLRNVNIYGISDLSVSTGGFCVSLDVESEVYSVKISFTAETSVGKQINYKEI